MAKLTVLLLLTTKLVSLGLAAGALSFYRSDGASQDTIHTSSPEWSTTLLYVEFFLCVVEFVVQLLRLLGGLRPLPQDSQFRFTIMTADVVLALVTWGTTSSLLGVSSFLRRMGYIDHGMFLRLQWHGRLGMCCGIVSTITAVINVFVANEPEAQHQPPGAP